MVNPYTNLARKTLEMYLKNGTKPQSDIPTELSDKKAGVFVSLHHKNDDSLRGCIGTILPVTNSIAQEIIANAISAATQDPRFPAVKYSELTNLKISVDVLTTPEPISSPQKLNPKKYGVIVRTTDGRSGLLLPNLQGVNDVNYQINIAAQKGGIDLNNDEIILERFEVIRYHEED